MRGTLIQTAFLGDVVLTLPLLDAIEHQFPNSRWQFVCRPEAVTVIETHPIISSVLVYQKRGADSGVAGWLRMRKAIRKFQPELVLCPHRSARSVLLAGVSQAQMRIGYDRCARVPGLSHRVKYRSDQHETVRLLDLLSPITHIVGTPQLPRIHLTSEDTLLATQFVLSEKSTIAIAPGAVWNTKRWLPEYFVEVARTLSTQGYAIITIGGQSDAQLCEEVASAGNGINLAGKLSPRQSAAVLAHCSAILTNDSAPLHLAQAVGTPTIALFGATVPAFGFGPQAAHDQVLGVSIDCRPCAIHGGNHCPKQHFRCMRELTPDLAIRAIQQSIGSSK